MGPRAVIATSPGTDTAGLGSACLLLLFLLSVNPTVPVVLHLLQSLSVAGVGTAGWTIRGVLRTVHRCRPQGKGICGSLGSGEGAGTQSPVSGKSKAVSPGSARALVPGALLGLVQLLKAEATAGVGAM